MAKVYLICNPATEQYKVGVTKNDINKRLMQLQTGNGNELHIVAYHETDNPYYIERMIHKELNKYNVKNEWFEIVDVNPLTEFKRLCNKYEGVIANMKDNPFFMKMLRKPRNL